MDKVTLFGKDKNGSIKLWSIWTIEDHLFIEHGKINGKLQLKEEVVEGKNKGRSNETSGSQQAELEAKSRISKQIDRGYRQNTDDLEELEIMPMLAHDYLKQGHRIKYPCYGSPKLDGVRCLAIRYKDSVELKSRGGKRYSLPHIESQLLSIMQEGDIYDGEIYLHGKYLEEIVSAVKKPNDLTTQLQYVIFDVVNDSPYEDRAIELIRLRRNVIDPEGSVRVLQFVELANEGHMKIWHDNYVEDGFEGICLRNFNGKYESGKRSADLQKYKEFKSEEFKITGVEEDRNGNAVFQVWDDLAKAYFTVTCGDFEERKRQLANPDEFFGKWLTVKYQTRYKDSKLPQFPTGVCIRDCNNAGEPLE